DRRQPEPSGIGAEIGVDLGSEIRAAEGKACGLDVEATALRTDPQHPRSQGAALRMQPEGLVHRGDALVERKQGRHVAAREQEGRRDHGARLAPPTRSKADRSPSASLTSSSTAQKCMKKSRGSSSSMWLWTAVTSIPCSRRARSTGFTSAARSTKSPVIAAFPPPVGWKLSAVAIPIAGGIGTPPSRIVSGRATLT